MIIDKIELRNVTVHKCFTLTLPQTGVVLITGPNGSGKSTVLEGVSVGAWGKTLRGKSVWTEQDGQILVRARVQEQWLDIDRKRVKGRGSLKFDAATYDTESKAQEALDPLVGSHELWRRSCAFSSRDSAHFTESGDADRKRLIESVLGLDKLDEASILVRKDLRQCGEQVEEAGRNAELLEQKVALLSRELRDDAQELSQLRKPDGEPVEVSSLRRKKQEYETEIEELEQPIGDMQMALGRLDANVEQAKARAVRLNAHKVCPTCEQPISTILKERLIEVAQDLALDSEAARKDLVDHKAKIGAQLKIAKHRLEKVRQKISDAQGINTAHANYEHAKEHLAKRVEARRQELADLSDEQDEIEEQLHMAQKQLAELEVVDKVLSTKGIRAHLLHNALAFIETTANYWLDRVAGKGLRLRLTPYTESSKGMARDVIGLEVEGAGGGNGYKGASGGERRRIDIALMLALGEVARASNGGEVGTLFLDECLDALDAEGVDAVVDVVSDLAQTRAVVVISHNEDVVRGLRNVHEHVRLEKA